MFVDQMRAAITAAPKVELGKISTSLWRAWGAGGLSDDEAQRLSDLIEARKALPAPEKPVQRRLGSRPRSPASMERRRSWASSGHMPPQVARRFTLGEQAVLAVIAVEVRKHGACTLTIGHIATLAGVCPTSVRNALREAVGLGFVCVEERRLTAWRNAPNRVTVLDAAWLAWLRLRRAGVGTKPCTPRLPEKKEGTAYRPQRAAGREGAASLVPKSQRRARE